MRNLIFLIIFLLGILSLHTSGNVHLGSIKENGKVGIQMFLLGLVLIAIGLLGIYFSNSKKE